MKKSIFLFVGVIFFFGFLAFSKYVKQGHLRSFDFAVTVKLQDRISTRFDQLMDDGAIFADPFVSSGIVILLTAWFFLKMKGKRKIFVFIIPLSFVLLTMVEVYGKNYVPHPGPPFFMIKQPTTIFPKFHIVEPYSYPSGHTARITFLAIILLVVILKQIKSRTISQIKKKPHELIGVTLILGYVVFVAISRIYLGHHWLSDIIGGVLLAGGLSFAPLVFLGY